ncbi:unknown protein [Desulfotalea psychrophila LSv54]|uniref:Uncharacterized protein n=2 Tax=Desulfotalea psychrophila TaxID=84980 RepID=Q6ALL7_DESPS|nr:unknown protein [Desulfotalea psychrophila LSv54]
MTCHQLKTYALSMKTVKQRQIANYLGISEVFIHEIKMGKKKFSRAKANSLAELTKVPFELLMLAEGGTIYKRLVESYLEQKQKSLGEDDRLNISTEKEERGGQANEGRCAARDNQRGAVKGGSYTGTAHH